MKKILLSLLVLGGVLNMQAQEDDSEEQKEGWTTEANIQLLFNQSAFNAE